MLRESRENFFRSLGSDIKKKPKRFWSVLKRNSKSRSIPDFISMATDVASNSMTPGSRPRTTAENPEEIANLFNRYFATVFNNDVLADHNTAEPDEPVITQLTLCDAEVHAVLTSLDATKATGPDEIPSRLLKQTADVIAPSLCKLFNKSLLSGTLPEEWKLANVVPVYKKGDKEHTENYRPISLLSIVSKVLERCVLNNIKAHLLDTITGNQHGFITGRSCVTNLIATFDYVGSILDKGGQTDVVYLDMSKAFDKVNHQLLIRNLGNKFGFGGHLLQWFRSYLSNRRQRVTVLGATSDTLPVTSGVPQGSILGPALFLLYANDLPSTVQSSQVAMFADDTKLFKAVQTTDDAVKLQADLLNLEVWSSNSGLIFNESKCKTQTIVKTNNYHLHPERLPAIVH